MTNLEQVRQALAEIAAGELVSQEEFDMICDALPALYVALQRLNALRCNIIATQSATWSNTVYPLVAILKEAGMMYVEPTYEQAQQHRDCYGGAGGYPGQISS